MLTHKRFTINHFTIKRIQFVDATTLNLVSLKA